MSPHNPPRPVIRGDTQTLPENSSLILTNEVSRTFSHHDCWQIGIGAWDARHDRGIDNAQVVHAVDPTAMVNNRHWIVRSANGACADRMRHWCRGGEKLFVAELAPFAFIGEPFPWPDHSADNVAADGGRRVQHGLGNDSQNVTR